MITICRGVFFVLCAFRLWAGCELSVEEKVGQVLMVHFRGEESNEDARVLVEDVGVGGIIYYDWANGLSSQKKVRDLSEALQRRAHIPLLIAIDEEGGCVTRLKGEFTVFPGNKAVAMMGQEEWAELCAEAVGEQLRLSGINLNLAPVVDINSNPQNPVIGIRSFGESKEVVLRFAARTLEGYHKAGILTCLKHFPGHGDVTIDSHEDLPCLNKSKEELRSLEFVPFYELASQSDTIMAGHIMVPALDTTCATLSKPILDILRLEMGFQGVVIADSLVMEGLLKACPSIDEAAIRALNAGCDILLLGGKQLMGTHANLELCVSDIQKIHAALVQAVHAGRIPLARLDEAVQRVLALKSRIPCADKTHAYDYQALAKKIASKALRSVSNSSLPLPPSQSRLLVVAPAIVKENIEKTSLCQMGKETTVFFFTELNPSLEEMQTVQKMAKEAEMLIFCSYNAWKHPLQSFLMQSLRETCKPIILIALRDPIDANALPQAHLILTTFSPVCASIQAACDALQTFMLPLQHAPAIAERIWYNECGGELINLTAWNEGENFASLGIGHFIWYSPDKQERFQETFPDLIAFLKEEGIVLPAWLTQSRGCPWSSRREFCQNLDSPKMAFLRRLLFETRHHQAIFMAKRLESALPLMLASLSPTERTSVEMIFYRLAYQPRGLYALVDYLNFKGAGIVPAENYKGEGWGLLQVLRRLSPSTEDPLAAFIAAARQVLIERVQNAPSERHEERWLAGWLNRISSY